MLTKTGFLAYLDAPMHLWALSHHQMDQTLHSAYDEFLAQQGQEVEALARQYLEGGILAGKDHLRLAWQPTYKDDRFYVRADALVYDAKAGVYDLYEIKSATSVQKTHEYDLTFQVLLLETQIPLRDVYLLHIDKNYQHGHQLDLAGFFTVEEISPQVAARREEVTLLREAAWEVTQSPVPNAALACTKPGSCPCPDLCHPDLPENPVYSLPYIGKKALTLRDMGILAMEDIPGEFSLTPKQQLHLEAVRAGEPIIDTRAIVEALATMQYPLYFLDYETFNPAVPLFQGYQPYEHIVFQYSLFVVQEPGAEPQHYEALFADGQDPAPKIVPDLLSHIGPTGAVVVWNQSFEAGRNQTLARHCPSHADRLLDINERLYDLMLIFRDGHYVHPRFQGSASLKAVLPVMCPELTYTGLAIPNGEAAMLTWYQLHTGAIPPEESAEILDAMKAYCKLDTYGMVAIWKQLRQIIGR